MRLDGADQLAATAAELAALLRGGLDGEAAAEELVGYITHPRTPGFARDLHVEPTPAGFALVATGTEPLVQALLSDPFDVRAQAIAENYADQLQQLVDETLKGS